MVTIPPGGAERRRGLLDRLLRRVPVQSIRRLPSAVAVPWLSHLQGGRADVHDVREISLPAPFRLQAYWLRAKNGSTGPAASVWIGTEEIMRIDGLRGDCHVHYDLARSRGRGGAAVAARRVVADADIATWASDELRLNLRYSISMQRPGRRRLRVDRDALDTAARRLRSEFEAFLAEHGHDRGRT